MAEALELIEKGNQAMQNGDEETALKCFTRVLESDPEHAQALFCVGTILSSRGEFETAIQFYARSAQFAGERAPLPLFNMGNALQAIGSFAEAIQAFEMAIQLDPTMSDAWINRGRLLDDKGKHKEALESYDIAIEIDPNDAMAWCNRGNSLRAMENYQEALASYVNSLQLDPSEYKAYLGAAVCYAHLGNPNKGLEMFEDLADFAEPWIMVEHSIVLALAKRYQNALDRVNEALDYDPNIAEAWNNRAEFLWKLDRPEEALKSFNRALDLDDTYYPAWFGKARLLWNTGRKQESRDAIERYFFLTPGSEAAFALKDLLEGDGLKVNLPE